MTGNLGGCLISGQLASRITRRASAASGFVADWLFDELALPSQHGLDRRLRQA
jgi:hypothetical protein